MGPLWKKTPISRALLKISFRFPSKGALLPGSPHRADIERHCSQRPPSVKVPNNWAHSRFPNGVPIEREMLVSRAFFYTSPDKNKNLPFLSKSPVKETPPIMFPHLSGERCSVSKASGWFHHLYLSESPFKELSHPKGGKHGHCPQILT